MTGPYADARRDRLNPLFQHEFTTLERASTAT
jgi:hypothetical protein